MLPQTKGYGDEPGVAKQAKAGRIPRALQALATDIPSCKIVGRILVPDLVARAPTAMVNAYNVKLREAGK